MDESPKPSLLERLSQLMLREPEDRQQLVGLLHSAFERQILDADALSIGTTSSMSWMVWTKPNDNVQNHVIAKGIAGSYEWGLLRGVLPLFTNGTGYVMQIWQSGGNSYSAVQTGANSVPNNQWAHIVATISTGSVFIIYLNGIEKGRSTSFSSITLSCSPVVELYWRAMSKCLSMA